jgi:hypothetical protein
MSGPMPKEESRSTRSLSDLGYKLDVDWKELVLFECH